MYNQHLTITDLGNNVFSVRSLKYPYLEGDYLIKKVEESLFEIIDKESSSMTVTAFTCYSALQKYCERIIKKQEGRLNYVRFKNVIGESKNTMVSLKDIRYVDIEVEDYEYLCVHYGNDFSIHIDFNDRDALNRAYQNLCRLLEVEEL